MIIIYLPHGTKLFLSTDAGTAVDVIPNIC